MDSDELYTCPGCGEPFASEEDWVFAHTCDACDQALCECPCFQCPACAAMFDSESECESDHFCGNCKNFVCACSCSDECCDECDADPCTCENLRSTALENWDLPEFFELVETCSLFYIQYDILLLDPTADSHPFDTLVSTLDGLFRRYVDMIVGGEVRHMISDPGGPVSDQLSAALSLTPNLTCPSRSSAWCIWKNFRAEHGLIALDWAIDAFGEQRRSLGGKTWSNIARTLKRREIGELSPILFIDACFGMEHNSGTFFDKACWLTSGLTAVLDGVRTGNLGSLYPRVPKLLEQKHRKLLEVENEASSEIQAAGR